MAGTENDDKAAAWKAAAMARMGSFSDDELDEALKDFVETADGMEMSELLKTMNEQNVITWDEAERILSDGKP